MRDSFDDLKELSKQNSAKHATVSWGGVPSKVLPCIRVRPCQDQNDQDQGMALLVHDAYRSLVNDRRVDEFGPGRRRRHAGLRRRCAHGGRRRGRRRAIGASCVPEKRRAF